MKKIRVFNFAIFACLVAVCLFMAGCQGLSGDSTSGSTSDGSSSGTTSDDSSSGDTSSNGGTTADTNGSSISYGWDATTTTYRVDPSKVVGNGVTLSVDAKTGYLTVSGIGSYGEILIPLATTDTQFMGNITKIMLTVSSTTTSGTKKTCWRVTNSTSNSYGSSGENALESLYMDYPDDWSSTVITKYFNGTSSQFAAFSTYTSPVAVAFGNNTYNATSALTGNSYVVESIVFSK
jgi:hypothetical protein